MKGSVDYLGDPRARRAGMNRLFQFVDENWSEDEIIDAAGAEHDPAKTYLLCSGGNDSMVLLHYAKRAGWDFDAVVHVNTGTGVCEDGVFLTTEFLREQCGLLNLPLIELCPPKSFEEVFLDDPICNGLPGPGLHHIAYNRLKERALRVFVAEQKERWRDRIMFLTGIRRDESASRMGYSGTIIDRIGAQVWVNPIYNWSNERMAEYRRDHQIPENPVSAHLHISGECLCGSFAKPGELDEIRFFFPQTAERIKAWEQAAQDNGLRYCQWGQRRPDEDSGKDMRLCSQCVGQMGLFAPEEPG